MPMCVVCVSMHAHVWQVLSQSYFPQFILAISPYELHAWASAAYIFMLISIPSLCHPHPSNNSLTFPSPWGCGQAKVRLPDSWLFSDFRPQCSSEFLILNTILMKTILFKEKWFDYCNLRCGGFAFCSTVLRCHCTTDCPVILRHLVHKLFSVQSSCGHFKGWICLWTCLYCSQFCSHWRFFLWTWGLCAFSSPSYLFPGMDGCIFVCFILITVCNLWGF